MKKIEWILFFVLFGLCVLFRRKLQSDNDQELDETNPGKEVPMDYLLLSIEEILWPIKLYQMQFQISPKLFWYNADE